jgi:hypothetical protein
MKVRVCHHFLVPRGQIIDGRKLSLIKNKKKKILPSQHIQLATGSTTLGSSDYSNPRKS